MVIVYCMMVYEERMVQVKRCVERVRSHLDRCVIVHDSTLSEESKSWLRSKGCELYYREWNDDFSLNRTEYLHRAGPNNWVLVSDPDELMGERLCQDLRKIVADAEREGKDQLLINSHDINHDADNEIRVSVSNFFKALLFKNYPGTRYFGTPHETLMRGGEGQWKVKTLPREYYYEHEKWFHEVWERASRNVFIAGGGNNVRFLNKQWVPLRAITDRLGIKRWPEMRAYLRRGNVDSELKQWMVNNRRDGTDFEHEMMEMFRWYFEFLHPSENTGGWKPIMKVEPHSSEGIMRYVEQCYLQVLGRHADQGGKENYMRLIQEGKIRREDLPNILRSSPEWKERFGK